MKTIIIATASCFIAFFLTKPIQQSSNNDLYEIHSSVIKTLRAEKYKVAKETDKVYLSFLILSNILTLVTTKKIYCIERIGKILLKESTLRK